MNILAITPRTKIIYPANFEGMSAVLAYTVSAANRLAELRRNRGITQRELAAACRLTLPTIKRYEHLPDLGRLQLSLLECLARRLSCYVADLLAPAGAPKPIRRPNRSH